MVFVADASLKPSRDGHLAARTHPTDLFCLPHAGGSPSLFRRWQPALDPYLRVVPVQLPGRERRIRETPWTDPKHAADCIASQIAADVDRPYIVFGHSLGAIFAFEAALRLESVLSVRYRPAGVIVSGQRPLHLLRPQEGPLRSELPEAELTTLLRSYEGTPAEILDCAEVRTLFLKLVRADFKLFESYRYLAASRLSCPLLILSGSNDVLVSVHELGRWDELTREVATVRTFRGGHFYFERDLRSVCASIIAFTHDVCRSAVVS